MKSILKEVRKNGIASILVEGGAKNFSSFVKQDLFDDIILFISPKILGNGVKTFSELIIKQFKACD